MKILHILYTYMNNIHEQVIIILRMVYFFFMYTVTNFDIYDLKAITN